MLPTGGGKSLCYQAPAAHLRRLAVVVSPLIALMKDQVDGLREAGVPAAVLNSSQTPAERAGVMRAVAGGGIQLLYLAPERLVMDGFLERLQRAAPAFFAVDEAHCISQWGHDFRPEYRQLRALRAAFPAINVHAYTATATPQVRGDIVSELRLKEPKVLVGSFDRPNLIYRVRPRTDKLAQVAAAIQRHRDQAGIVYCIRRSEVEELTAASDAAGEVIWRLPLGDDQRDYIKSDPADIVNSGGREGHPLQGGAFLSYFVKYDGDDKTPWAHLDIAGVADTEKEQPVYAKGATGWGVRTLVNWVESRGGRGSGGRDSATTTRSKADRKVPPPAGG